jgi:uncharacterized protein YndB with AHSA1/START domain
MSSVHVTIDIEAPVQRVWDTIMDPERLQDWVTIHRSVRDVSDEPLIEGSTMEQVLHIRGVSFHVHWTLVEVSAPHRAVWEGRGPAHSRARILYQLSTDSGERDGPTEFEYMNEFTPPGGRLGTIASNVIVGAASEREARISLSRLKALLERG